MLITFKRKDSFTKDALLLYILPTLAVLIALALITFWSWTTTKQNYFTNRQRVVTQDANKLQSLLAERLRIYGEVLRGGAGLFEGSDFVTRQEWKNFITAYDVQKRYPGIESIGYIYVAKPADIAEFVANQKVQISPDFAIYPSGERPQYGIVTYVEPETDVVNEGLGYDMSSEPTRQMAMQQAASTNRAVITGKLPPRVGSAVAPQPMFNMYFPIFDKTCIEQSMRRPACAAVGYTYASFRVNSLVADILLAGSDNFNPNFSLYDGSSADQRNLLYRSSTFSDTQLTATTSLLLFSKKWTLSIQLAEESFSPRLGDRPTFVLIAGTVISAFVTMVVFTILLQRTRSLRSSRDKEIMQVKDELLALAAHQLRTPATAVKQYTIMAMEGYGGELNPEQLALVTKAYENNERQLHTVNEMLYVANVDAGKIHLQFKDTDLVKIIGEAIDEQATNIREKGHTLVKHLPSTPLHYAIDELYFRMAISNIISNAIKYTPPKGKIHIGLSVSLKSIQIKVKDNGVGISSKQMPGLFKKFSRLDNPLSANTMGSGLGLYLANKVVGLHNGHIKVESSPKTGSEFTIMLPRRRFMNNDTSVKQ